MIVIEYAIELELECVELLIMMKNKFIGFISIELIIGRWIVLLLLLLLNRSISKKSMVLGI